MKKKLTSILLSALITCQSAACFPVCTAAGDNDVSKQTESPNKSGSFVPKIVLGASCIGGLALLIGCLAGNHKDNTSSSSSTSDVQRRNALNDAVRKLYDSEYRKRVLDFPCENAKRLIGDPKLSFTMVSALKISIALNEAFIKAASDKSAIDLSSNGKLFEILNQNIKECEDLPAVLRSIIDTSYGFIENGKDKSETDTKEAEPKKNEPKKDKPKKDKPKKDKPKKDKPKKDEPKKDKPKKDEPKKNEPKKDEPKEDEPKKGKRKTDEPKKNGHKSKAKSKSSSESESTDEEDEGILPMELLEKSGPAVIETAELKNGDAVKLARSWSTPIRAIFWHDDMCWFNASLLLLYHHPVYNALITNFPIERAEQFLQDNKPDPLTRYSLEATIILSKIFRALNEGGKETPRMVTLNPDYEKLLINRLKAAYGAQYGVGINNVESYTRTRLNHNQSSDLCAHIISNILRTSNEALDKSYVDAAPAVTGNSRGIENYPDLRIIHSCLCKGRSTSTDGGHNWLRIRVDDKYYSIGECTDNECPVQEQINKEKSFIANQQLHETLRNLPQECKDKLSAFPCARVSELLTEAAISGLNSIEVTRLQLAFEIATNDGSKIDLTNNDTLLGLLYRVIDADDKVEKVSDTREKVDRSVKKLILEHDKFIEECRPAICKRLDELCIPPFIKDAYKLSKKEELIKLRSDFEDKAALIKKYRDNIPSYNAFIEALDEIDRKCSAESSKSK